MKDIQEQLDWIECAGRAVGKVLEAQFKVDQLNRYQELYREVCAAVPVGSPVKFDRVAYQRDYMREWRARKKLGTK